MFSKDDKILFDNSVSARAMNSTTSKNSARFSNFLPRYGHCLKSSRKKIFSKSAEACPPPQLQDVL